MSKSKEEILKSKFQRSSDVEYNPVHEAMDEHAKETAITYDQWKIDNRWEWSTVRFVKDIKSIWFQMPSNGTYFTHEELFEQFLETLNK